MNSNLTEIIDLPKYVYPDLTNKEGYWAASMPENSIKENDIIFFYLDSSGLIHYGINDNYGGVFLSGVDIFLNGKIRPMWAIIDVYGNTLAVQLSNFVQDSNEEVTAGQNGLIHSDSLSPDGKTWLHFILQLWGAKN